MSAHCQAQFLWKKSGCQRATPTLHHPQKQQTSESLIKTAKRPRKNKTSSILDVIHPAPCSALFFLRLCHPTQWHRESGQQWAWGHPTLNAGRCRQGGETGRTRPWQDHLCFSSSSPPHHSQSLFPNYLPDLLPDTEGDGAKCRRAGQRCVVIALSTVLSTPQKHTVQTQPFRAASNSKPT